MEAAVWTKAPPEIAAGGAEVATGAATGVADVLATGVEAAAGALEPADAAEPELVPVRSPTVDGSHWLGPEDQPVKRLAISEQ